ncbi:MAG: murein biosynthesis integral membrane protein MurJ [Anaerolineales bacterium]|nr:murein biosynthesis integral membrane protein MurJ [Anaerolineales bacterium]
MQNSFAKDTITVSLFNALGVVSSFAIDVGIASVFGLGRVTDAFFVAATIPLLAYIIFNRISELTLVPIFVRWQTEMVEEQWQLFSSLLWLAFGSLSCLVLVSAFLAEPLFYAIAPGLDTVSSELANHLGTIMLLSVPLSAVVAISRARLNAARAFSQSASSNFLRNIVVLIFLTLTVLAQWNIDKIAVGYLAAGLVQMLVLFFFLRQLGFRLSFNLLLTHTEIRSTVNTVLFPLFSFAVNQSNEIVERFLASFLVAGSLSALVFARRLIGTIVNIFLNSITSVIIPSLSRLSVKQDRLAMQHVLAQGVKIIFLLTTPMTVLLLVLNQPVIRILFLHGSVVEEGTALISKILVLYVLGLPFLGLNQLLVAPHYALGDTKTPAIHLLLMIIVQIGLDMVLFWWLGVWGIPIAMSLTAVISVLRALWLLKQKNLSVLDMQLFAIAGKLLVASVGMGLTNYLIYSQWIIKLPAANLWSQLIVTILSVVCGSIVLFVVAKALNLKPTEFTVA